MLHLRTESSLLASNTATPDPVQSSFRWLFTPQPHTHTHVHTRKHTHDPHPVTPLHEVHPALTICFGAPVHHRHGCRSRPAAPARCLTGTGSRRGGGALRRQRRRQERTAGGATGDAPGRRRLGEAGERMIRIAGKN